MTVERDSQRLGSRYPNTRLPPTATPTGTSIFGLHDAADKGTQSSEITHNNSTSLPEPFQANFNVSFDEAAQAAHTLTATNAQSTGQNPATLTSLRAAYTDNQRKKSGVPQEAGRGKACCCRSGSSARSSGEGDERSGEEGERTGSSHGCCGYREDGFRGWKHWCRAVNGLWVVLK